MEFINLSNVKVQGTNVELEFLYKDTSISDDACIFIETSNKQRYEGIFKKCANRVTYSYNNEDVEIAKFFVKIPILECGEIKLKLQDKEKTCYLKIHNNKNENITSKENPYIIFLKLYKIQITENKIEVTKRKCFDKIKYELNKQLYGIKKYNKLFIYRIFKTKKQKYYLFNDRLLYGDDNAEELFIYINKKYPQFAKKCYFVLDKKSTSIDRISKIGKVLKFGSHAHKVKFINSRMVLSSHASYLGNCFNPFTVEEMDIYKDIINKKFVFLQHGVIMNDVREYLNRQLINADLFVVSTKNELEYLMSDDFMYESNMICGSGLPRFDKLKNDIQKVILISPTWRNLPNDIQFNDSEYYKTYKSLLTNNKLNDFLMKNNYKIKFLLHPVFSEYNNLFKDLSNENIEILESSEIRYSLLFNECSIFITDYSSIHFDVATLQKPIIYYQFDKKYFFEKHYKSGYFDYEKDGFGKVVINEDEIVNEIERYVEKNCTIDDEYKMKIHDTFIYLDNNNCKRLFDEIVKIDTGSDVNYRFNNVH